MKEAYASDYPPLFKTCVPVDKDICNSEPNGDFFKWFGDMSDKRGREKPHTPQNDTLYVFVSYLYWMNLYPNHDNVQVKAIAAAGQTHLTAVYNDQLNNVTGDIPEEKNEIYRTVIDSHGHGDSRIDYTPHMISIFYVGGNDLTDNSVSFSEMVHDAVKKLVRKIRKFYVINGSISAAQIVQPCILIDHFVVDVSFVETRSRKKFLDNLKSFINERLVSPSGLYRIRINYLHVVGDVQDSSFEDDVSDILEVGHVFKVDSGMRNFKLGPEALVKSVLCLLVEKSGSEDFITKYNSRFDKYLRLFEYKIKKENRQVRKKETISSYQEQPLESTFQEYQIEPRMTVIPNDNDIDQLFTYDIIHKKKVI